MASALNSLGMWLAPVYGPKGQERKLRKGSSSLEACRHRTFQPRDRLEAYPTLRRRLVAVGRRREKVLSGALESSLDTPGSNVAFFSRLAFVCVSVLYRTRLRLERPTQQQHLHQQYSVGVVENIAMRALHKFWNLIHRSSDKHNRKALCSSL